MEGYKKKIFAFGFILFTAAVFAVTITVRVEAQSSRNEAEIIRWYDFEDGLIPDDWNKDYSCFRAEVEPVILTDPDGNHFVRITASPDDHLSVPSGIDTVRSQCSLGGGGSITENDWIRTYYLSVRFSDPSPQTTTAMQLFQYGEGSGYAVKDDSGPSLRLYRRDSALIVMNEFDQNTKQQELDLGKIGINQFAHIAITVYWTLDPAKGRVDVWQDGHYAGSLTGEPTILGPTALNFPGMHIGSYGGAGVGYIDFDDVGYGKGTAPGSIPTTNFCHLLDSSDPVPTGFSAAYNVLSSVREVLLKAVCGESSVDYPVGNGSNLQYVYNHGYYWGGSSWQQFTYQCQGQTISGSWCVGSADFTRNLFPPQQQNTNYYVAYVCNWTGSTWKCGCRDQTCSTNYWNLQTFRKP